MRPGLSLNADELDQIEGNLQYLEQAVADRNLKAEPIEDWHIEIRRIRLALDDARGRASYVSPVKRDSQRSKVYRAENSVATVGGGDDKLTPAQATAFVRSVVFDPTVMANYPRLDGARVILNVVRQRATASCRSVGPHHTLTVPVTALSKRILLHEIAHAITSAHFGKLNVAGHGPEFVVTLCRLIGRFLGLPAQRAYAEAFALVGVKARFTTRSLPWDAPGAPHLKRKPPHE